MPSPVAKRTATDPRAAGLLVLLRLPSWLKATTSPEPVSAEVNRPGAEAATGIENAAAVWPR
jgi:hypothetical protein